MIIKCNQNFIGIGIALVDLTQLICSGRKKKVLAIITLEVKYLDNSATFESILQIQMNIKYFLLVLTFLVLIIILLMGWRILGSMEFNSFQDQK